MSGDRDPMGDMLRAGTVVGVNLGMGFVMFVPTTRSEHPAERGPGRLGTLPTKPKHKPAHGGYPEANSHKLDPREYQPVSFPAPKKPSPFSIVRN